MEATQLLTIGHLFFLKAPSMTVLLSAELTEAPLAAASCKISAAVSNICSLQHMESMLLCIAWVGRQRVDSILYTSMARVPCRSRMQHCTSCKYMRGSKTRL